MASFQKAERLRQKENATDKREGAIIYEWTRKRVQAKTVEKKEEIDKKYSARCKEAAYQSSKAYKEYYDYIHQNFSKEEIEKARKASGDFTKKSFLTKLFGGVAKPKRSPAKKTPAKKTAKKVVPKKTAPKKPTAKKATAKRKK